jgi:uncharacterized protein YodC (DUF2158 family)
VSSHRFSPGDRVRYEAGGYPATVDELVDDDGYLLTWDDGFTEDDAEDRANVWRDHELVAYDDIMWADRA